MGIDYDTWLQKPYQDSHEAQDAYDEAKESFIGTDSYHESYGFWLETNEGKSEEDWQETSDFESSVECFQALKNEVPTREEYEQYSGW
jgi:hypothetical protein